MFAAVLSAFLVYTIPQLQPNSTDISKDILLHISLQLSNSSVPAYVEPLSFVPANAAVTNTLLFTSLALVIVDAYLAVLTRGWLREFDRSWRASNVPEERARAREMRFQALKQYRLPEVVALLPLLIQASLILFGVALIIMLLDLYRPTAYPPLVIIVVGVLFYFSTTVVSALDTNAPFTSPFSRALQVLINIRWSQLQGLFSATLSHLSWGPRRNAAEDVQVMRTETQLAIYNRLYAATSKAVENLPVFTALFDQWVHAPFLRPRSMNDWRPVLPLIQPFLLNTSLSKDFGLRSVARLFLCFNLKEQKGQQALIEALRERDRDPEEQPSIEQLYIHLLHQPDPDWSSTRLLVLKLKADNDTIIELRWILNWIAFRFLDQSQEFPNGRDSSWVSSIRNIIPFLRSIAVYIIQNRIANGDHRLFDLLLRVTQLIVDGFKEVDKPHPSTRPREPQTSSESIYGGLFVSIRDLPVPPESQWEFIHNLYAASSMSAAGFNRDFTLLLIMLMISTLSAVEYSRIDASVTYDPFINLQKDLPVLMDGLWEIWQADGVDHYLLTGIAAWILNQSRGSFRKPPQDAQQRSLQDLLSAYDSYTSGAIPLVTSSARQFIGAALSFSLNLFNWGMKWQPQTLELKNPWLVMHIHNILRCEWRIPGGEMGEAVWGRLERPRPPNVLGQVERLDLLDLLERLDLLDHEVDHPDQVDHLLDHQVDHLLDHLLNQQVDQQIKSLLDEQVRQIRQIREQLQPQQQPPQQLLQQLPQQLHQQHLQHLHVHQMLQQMLPQQLYQLHQDQQLKQQLPQLFSRFQQLFPPLQQVPDLERTFQRLSQMSGPLIQKIEQMLEQRECEFDSQREHGLVEELTQELRQKELHQVFQEFIQEYLPFPPPDSPPDPPLPSLDPLLDPPLPPLDSLFDPSIDPSLDPPLPQLDSTLPQLDPLIPPLPYLEKLLSASLLTPLLSQIPRHFPLFSLLSQLDQQLRELDQLFKQRDYRLFKQRDKLLELLLDLQVQRTRWLQQWLQRLREQIDQQLDQQLDQEIDQELDQQLVQQEEQLKQLKFRQLRQQLRQLDLQRSAVLELIAKQRLELYNAKELHPDPVVLSLFLSSHNEDILNSSRRLTLEIFRSTPNLPFISLPNTSGREEENPGAARLRCSDFFDTTAIGDLTKWRLLASVVFPEWETLLPQWKDHLAAEVMKVDGVGTRVDWLARVTPLLGGQFNLYEFGLSDHDTWGYLTPTHLRMVATAVEHLGAERLAPYTVRELEDFLELHSNILDDKEALDRIRTVTKSQRR